MTENSETSSVADSDEEQSSTEFVEVCRAEDLPDGEKLAFEIDGQRVLVARVGQEFYAIGAVCTHERAFLDEGMIADGVVYCPLHYSAFDVRDGSVLAPPADRPTPTYAVTVADGVVQVSIAPVELKERAGAGADDESVIAEWPAERPRSMHDRVLHRIDESPWLDRSAQKLGSVASPARAKLAPSGVLDLLHGRWMGHAIHPALSDLPIGLWVGSFLLFLIGQSVSGMILAIAGVVSGLAAAATGVNDLTVADGHDRRVGVLHGLMMTVALLVETGAVVAYFLGSTVTATVLVGVGLVVTVSAAYLGGHLVLERGTMVNHAVWPTGSSGWRRAVESSDLEPGATRSVDIDGAGVLLYRFNDGERISAIENACSHAGGPLSQGKVCDGVVSCPWHASEFRLRDGAVMRGPATFSQPVLEVREVDTWIEVRRVPPSRPSGRS